MCIHRIAIEASDIDENWSGSTTRSSSCSPTRRASRKHRRKHRDNAETHRRHSTLPLHSTHKPDMKDTKDPHQHSFPCALKTDLRSSARHTASGTRQGKHEGSVAIQEIRKLLLSFHSKKDHGSSVATHNIPPTLFSIHLANKAQQ